MLDFHNHLIPEVDDGASSVSESRSGLKVLVEDGVTSLICTPHISISSPAHQRSGYIEKVEAGFARLTEVAKADFPSLVIKQGFEVMLDTPHAVIDDPRMTLAGTPYVLVEFPSMHVPPHSTYPLRELIDAGYIPIVAHPERYANIEDRLEVLEYWRRIGAFLQVNAGSFTGAYGARAKRVVMSIIARGQASFICSDYHSRGTSHLAPAFRLLTEIGFEPQLRTLTQNAEGILRGAEPVPVEPFTAPEPKPRWEKMLPWR